MNLTFVFQDRASTSMGGRRNSVSAGQSNISPHPQFASPTQSQNANAFSVNQTGQQSGRRSGEGGSGSASGRDQSGGRQASRQEMDQMARNKAAMSKQMGQMQVTRDPPSDW